MFLLTAQPSSTIFFWQHRAPFQLVHLLTRRVKFKFHQFDPKQERPAETIALRHALLLHASPSTKTLMVRLNRLANDGAMRQSNAVCSLRD